VLIYISRGIKAFIFIDLSAGGGVSGLVLANRLTDDPNGNSPRILHHEAAIDLSKSQFWCSKLAACKSSSADRHLVY
jgi:hypothetical protein